MNRILEYAFKKRVRHKDSQHVCFIVDNKNLKHATVLAFGYNYPVFDGGNTIHAEEMALSKLAHLYVKKNKPLYLIILRINNSYELSLSYPCWRCVLQMTKMVERGYRIAGVYYSGSDGILIYKNIGELFQEKPYINSFYRDQPEQEIRIEFLWLSNKYLSFRY